MLRIHNALDSGEEFAPKRRILRLKIKQWN
jgi:hypothetical protein